MAVEVKEIIVRALIEDESSTSRPSGASNTDEKAAERELLLKECVAQVLRIIRKDKHR